MAPPPPGRPGEMVREAEYTVQRYYRDGNAVVQNGRGYVNGMNGQLARPGQVPMRPYGKEMVPYGYNGQLAIPEEEPENEAHANSPKAQENRQAIKLHNKKKEKGKGKIREGKHAAVIDQIFENDLHNIKKVKPRVDEANGEAVDTNQRRYLNLYGEYEEKPEPSGLHHRPTVRPKDEDSELKTSFDPMRDRHMWTMWRTAVNGRIVDEVRRLERIKNERGPSGSDITESDGVYGKAIVAPPLRRFIRFDERSIETAHQLSSLGQGRLHCSQFVYYGLPRVYVDKDKGLNGSHLNAITNGPNGPKMITGPNGAPMNHVPYGPNVPRLANEPYVPQVRK